MASRERSVPTPTIAAYERLQPEIQPSIRCRLCPLQPVRRRRLDGLQMWLEILPRKGLDARRFPSSPSWSGWTLHCSR